MVYHFIKLKSSLKNPSSIGSQPFGGWKPKQAGFTIGTMVKGMQVSGKLAQQVQPSYSSSIFRKYSLVMWRECVAGCTPAIMN